MTDETPFGRPRNAGLSMTDQERAEFEQNEMLRKRALIEQAA
jgi:hypothetical protein